MAKQKLTNWIAALQEQARLGVYVSVSLTSKFDAGDGANRTITIHLHEDGSMTWDYNPYTVFTTLKWKDGADREKITMDDIQALASTIELAECYMVF